MASIQFGCPLCGAIAQIDGSMAGRQTNCPGCGAGVLVPAGQSTAAGPPPIIERPPRPGPPLPPVPSGTMAGQPPVVSGPPPVAVSRPPPAAGPPPAIEPPPAVEPEGADVPTAPGRPPDSAAAPGTPAPVEPADGSSRRTQSPAHPGAVRRLTPEERALRRFRRNIVMASLGLAILMIALAVLLRLSG